MKRLRRIWKDNKVAIICLALAMVLNIANIIFAHRLDDREQTIGEAYNTIESALYEINAVQELVDGQIHYLDHIYSTAEEYGVPPEVVVAVMKVESNFDPDAVYGRCYGLMQIHDVHCEPWNVTTEDLLDLRTNTTIGISLLSGLMDTSDNLTQVLGKFNRGQAGYAKYCAEVGSEVTSYSEKVENILNEWKE